MVKLFIIVEVIGICMIFTAIGLLLSGDGSREQKLMGYFLCGALVQNVGYLLELTAPTMEAALVATKIQYLGSISVPLFYCAFLYIYCYFDIPERILKVLGGVDFAILALIFTCDRHNLYYKSVGWPATAEGHHYLSIEYGPGYALFMVCSCMVPYMLSLSALARVIAARVDQTGNRKYKIILVLSILPVLALVSYAKKLTYVFDPTPVVLGVVLSSVVILIWSKRNYDFRNLAAEVVLNNMGDGVITLDDEKRIVSYNFAAAGIFTDLRFHKQGDSIEDMKDFQEELLDENEKVTFNFNENYYECHTKQIPDKNGKNQGYVILVLDVTDTRNYIEEIKSVREQAERANMAKSEFLANMSHEIRTPMNAIVGLSDIIMEESRGRKIYPYVCDIKSASQNLLAIINDILDLSKVEAGKMELVKSDYYIKAVINEVVGMMDMAASQHGLVLKYEYDESIPCRYNGDEGRIKQILTNLLNNAVKFTKEGHVRISVGGRPGDQAEEELLVFQVEDTGCGIRKEDQEKIFENFRQVDSKRNRSMEGTGLGLSITRRLVYLMNGTIELESVYGEGTTFTVTIPQKIIDKRTLAEMPEIPDKNVEEIETFVVDGNYKVLIVDDNLINRKVAKGFLKKYGFELSEAASGPESIKLVKETRYDIIFMDHMMPGMDGIEAVHLIREECGENGKTPLIIALTANAMEGVREKFLSAGFQDFIPKPLDRKALNEFLIKWIPADRRRTVEVSSEGECPDDGIEFGNIRIKGIDTDVAMRYHSGIVSDYLEVLHLYCMDGSRKLVLLRELFEKKDIRAYEIEVHALKSASANVGAMKLSALAREHEEAASRKDEEFIRRNIPDLLASYEKQLDHIREFLDATDMMTEEAEDLPEIEKEALVQRTGEALKQLENFHSKECAKQIEELLKHRLDAEVAGKLEKVWQCLKMYEDDEAEVLLGQLLEWMKKEE